MSSALSRVLLWTASRRGLASRRVLRLFFLLWLLGPGPSLAAFRGFLRIPGVPGESADPKHPDWIEISGFGSSVFPTSASAAVDFALIKGVDLSTPILNLACATGQPYPEMRIEFEVPDSGAPDQRQVRLYRLLLKTVSITSIITQFDPAATQNQIVDRISLSCASMDWSYAGAHINFLPLIYRSALWDLLRGGNARGIPVFRAAGSLSAAGTAEIHWTGRAGRSYRILAGSQVDGPYAPIAIVQVASNGTQRVSRKVIPGMRFFRVEESLQRD